VLLRFSQLSNVRLTSSWFQRCLGARFSRWGSTAVTVASVARSIKRCTAVSCQIHISLLSNRSEVTPGFPHPVCSRGSGVRQLVTAMTMGGRSVVVLQMLACAVRDSRYTVLLLSSKCRNFHCACRCRPPHLLTNTVTLHFLLFNSWGCHGGVSNTAPATAFSSSL
jgi:hypothetical protein